MASVTIDKKTGRPIVRVYGKKDPLTGEVYSPSKMLPKNATEADIQTAIEELELKAGFAKKHGKRFTIEGLLDLYLENLELADRAASSITSYRSNVKCYIKPFLGGKSYDELTPGDFTNLYRILKRNGGRNNQGLSQVTIKKLHTFLSGAFSSLAEEGVISYNVLAGVRVERGRSPEAVAMSEPDFAKLIQYLGSDQDNDDPFMSVMKTAVWLALHTGARRGEIAGFRVKNFRPKEKDIRVEKSLAEANDGTGSVHYKDPKSKTSKRIISLDDKTTTKLISHLRSQHKMLESNGIKQSGDTPIFAKQNGKPYRPSEYTTAFKRMVVTLGLDKRLTLHKLRHTHATYLIEKNENIRAVSERLGHSSIAITLGIYGHVLPGRDQEAAIQFGGLSESLGKGNFEKDYYA